jgi:hypothetical protein
MDGLSRQTGRQQHRSLPVQSFQQSGRPGVDVRAGQNIIFGSKTAGWIDPQISNGIVMRKQQKKKQ